VNLIELYEPLGVPAQTGHSEQNANREKAQGFKKKLRWVDSKKRAIAKRDARAHRARPYSKWRCALAGFFNPDR